MSFLPHIRPLNNFDIEPPIVECSLVSADEAVTKDSSLQFLLSFLLPKVLTNCEKSELVSDRFLPKPSTTGWAW